MKKKHAKSTALDRALHFAKEHASHLDHALSEVGSHQEAYEEVILGIREWVSSQVLIRRTA